MQNFNGLNERNLLPDELSPQKRTFNYNKMLKKYCLVDGMYILKDRYYDFYEEFFDLDLLEPFGDAVAIDPKTWKKQYDKMMLPAKTYIIQHKDELLTKLNDSIFQEMWDKYAEGNYSSWEMESLGFYYHDHELANVRESLYNIVEFNDLAEEPIVDYTFKRNGIEIPIFKTQRIMGTVIAKDDGKSIFEKCCELFDSINEQDLNEIYINRKDINNFSRILTGDWAWLQARMYYYAEEKFTTKAEKSRWVKALEDEGENKSKGFYTLAELNDVLKYSSDNIPETNIRVADYFGRRYRYFYEKETGNYIPSEELVALSIEEMCDDILVKRKNMDMAFETSEKEKLQEDSETVSKIKDYLDSLQELLHRVKPFKVNGVGESSFYANFDTIYSALKDVISIYNKSRNYLTKKAASPEKYKLNFDNPTLADGWDFNKEKDYTSVLFRKNGMFYLGIMNPKDKPKFADKYEVKDEDCYEKMIYKQFDAMKQIPKCSTQTKAVKQHFSTGTTEPFILNDKKSFLKELTVTHEIWFLNNHVWDGEKFVPKRDNETRPKKFQIGYYKQTGDLEGYKNALSIWITYCKDFLMTYKSSAIYDYHFKKAEEYKDLTEFFEYVDIDIKIDR